MGLDYNIPHGSSGGTELLTTGQVNLHCTPVEGAFPEEYGPPIWGAPLLCYVLVFFLHCFVEHRYLVCGCNLQLELSDVALFELKVRVAL